VRRLFVLALLITVAVGAAWLWTNRARLTPPPVGPHIVDVNVDVGK
jgi:hypothetical protein